MYKRQDWGGADHVGGGSHGSLHRSDSLGVMLMCGTGPDTAEGRRWTLADATRIALEHFSVPS